MPADKIRGYFLSLAKMVKKYYNRGAMIKITRKYIFIGVGVLIVGGIVLGAIFNKPKAEYTTADVSRGTLIQSVNETGTITPAKEIDLNFISSGQLSKLNVKVGDQVEVDQALAEIDSSSLAIKKQEAAAGLAMSQAGLTQAQLTADAAQREYDKLAASLNEAVKQAEKSQRDLEDTGSATLTTPEQAVVTAETTLKTTQATYQQGIDNKVDALKTTLDNKLASATTTLNMLTRIFAEEDPERTLGSRDQYTVLLARMALTEAKGKVASAEASMTQLKANATAANLDAAYASIDLGLAETFDALRAMFTVLLNSGPSSYLTQESIEAYKASVDSHTTATSTSIAALQAAKQALNDSRLSFNTNVLAAQQNVNAAKASYDSALTTARNTATSTRLNRDQQLASAQTRVDTAKAALVVNQAQVQQSTASLNFVSNQLSDNVLKSPIKGIITKINYEIGEQVAPSKALLSVLTENNFQIEVDIAETDIAKINLNDPAQISLDSLETDMTFEGKVYFIEPAATVIQGVTYYKVKISFDPKDLSLVKAGMTADATITTETRDNVLMMPARAVVERDNGKFVRILEGDTVREAAVTVGLSGDNGMVEVIDGVKEGDKVVTFVKDPAKK